LLQDFRNVKMCDISCIFKYRKLYLFIYLFKRQWYNYYFLKYKEDGWTARRTYTLKCVHVHRDYLYAYKTFVGTRTVLAR
jgi:hypothetical protein